MMKISILSVLMVLLSMGASANVEVVGGDSLTYPVQRNVSWDTVAGKCRKLAEVCQECIVMVEKGVKSEGVIGYIRKHKDVFLPIIVFTVLYLFWLRRRARN